MSIKGMGPWSFGQCFFESKSLDLGRVVFEVQQLRFDGELRRGPQVLVHICIDDLNYFSGRTGTISNGSAHLLEALLAVTVVLRRRLRVT